MSQRFRKRVEEVFGWMKTVGLMRKTRHRGTDRVGWVFTFTAAANEIHISHERTRYLAHFGRVAWHSPGAPRGP